MGGQMPTEAPKRVPLEFTEVGSGSAAGYDCRKIEATREGRKIREMCVVDWNSIEGGEEARAVMTDGAPSLRRTKREPASHTASRTCSMS